LHEDNLPPKALLLAKSDRAKPMVIQSDAFFIFGLSVGGRCVNVASSRRIVDIVDEMMGVASETRSLCDRILLMGEPDESIPIIL